MLTLEEKLDEDSRLVISCSGDHLTLACGDNSGVVWSKFGEDTASGLNTNESSKWADIDKNDIL